MGMGTWKAMPVSLSLDAGRYSLTALATPVDEGICTAMTPAPTRILATREGTSTVSRRCHDDGGWWVVEQNRRDDEPRNEQEV